MIVPNPGVELNEDTSECHDLQMERNKRRKREKRDEFEKNGELYHIMTTKFFRNSFKSYRYDTFEWTHTHTHILTHTHTHSHIYSLTHILTHTHTHSHTYSLTHEENALNGATDLLN